MHKINIKKTPLLMFLITCFFPCIFFTSCSELVNDGLDAIQDHTLKNVAITSNKSGDLVAGNITLKGNALNNGGEDITDDSLYQWSSDVDGNLGTGRNLVLQSPLTEGEHKITLETTAPSGARGKETITVRAGNSINEDFSNLDYCDRNTTTGRWNTAEGRATLSNYGSLSVTGSRTLNDPIGMAIAGNYAYIIDKDTENKLFKVDVSNPFNPTETGVYSFPAGFIARHVAVSPDGLHVYVSGRGSGDKFSILNSNGDGIPTAKSSCNPSVDGKILLSEDNTRAIIMEANDSGGVVIINITDLANPQVAKEVTYEGWRWMIDACIKGDYVYVASTYAGLYYLHVIDLNNIPEPPDHFWLTPVTLSESGTIKAVKSFGNGIAVGTTKGVTVYDISTPETPRALGSYSGYSIEKMSVAGNYIYAASGYEVIMLDFSNTALPVLVASCNLGDRIFSIGNTNQGDFIPVVTYGKEFKILSTYNELSLISYLDSGGSARNIAIKGNVAIAPDFYNIPFYDSNLDFLDINNLKSPSISASFDSFDGISLEKICDVAISDNGNYLYLPADDNLPGPNDGLIILDIGDPENPRVTGTWIGESASNVAIHGNRVALSNDEKLWIIDVSDPENPVDIANYEFGPTEMPPIPYQIPLSFSPDGRYVYAAYFSGHGIRVIDTEAPSGSGEAGFFSDTISASDIEISGSYAYVADGNTGLKILDISNPVSPSEVASLSAGINGRGVFIDNDILYLADGNNRVIVANVSDPVNPRIVNILNLPDSAVDIVTTGNNILISTSAGYLYVSEKTESCMGLYNLRQQIVQSKSITDENVYAARIVAEDSFSLDSGSIIYELSNDGDNWYPVGNNFILEFTGEPSGILLWRARLSTTDEFVTPEIGNVRIDYWAE